MTCQQVVLLLLNASVLGFRHGIDWDHIAAITDIVGTTTTARALQDNSASQMQRRALGLSTLYALGHAGVVAVLGVAALCFTAVLPSWIDPIMERVVGATLLLLGIWIFYSLAQYLQGKEEFELKSRWMLILSLFQNSFERLCALFSRRSVKATDVKQYGKRTAVLVGMLHGIGAETGTQVLLIAAVGEAASHELGLGMLAAFIVGLVLSNTLVAILGSNGFIKSSRAKGLYVSVGVLAGCFSLVIGSFFAIGSADALPSLQQAMGSQR